MEGQCPMTKHTTTMIRIMRGKVRVINETHRGMYLKKTGQLNTKVKTVDITTKPAVGNVRTSARATQKGFMTTGTNFWTAVMVPYSSAPHPWSPRGHRWGRGETSSDGERSQRKGSRRRGGAPAVRALNPHWARRFSIAAEGLGRVYTEGKVKAIPRVSQKKPQSPLHWYRV